MHAGEFIRERRLALNYKADEVANHIGLNLSSYFDLEQVDVELQTALSLAEIARLEALLAFNIRSVLSEWNKPAEISLGELAEAIQAHLQKSNRTVTDFENAAGWEIRSILTNPAEALEWNLDCLRDVCAALNIPWQSINFEAGLQL